MQRHNFLFEFRPCIKKLCAWSKFIFSMAFTIKFDILIKNFNFVNFAQNWNLWKSVEVLFLRSYALKVWCICMLQIFWACHATATMQLESAIITNFSAHFYELDLWSKLVSDFLAQKHWKLHFCSKNQILDQNFEFISSI